MSEKIRLFVALELPKNVLQALSILQADLQKQIPDKIARWVRPENIHLTLKFLGDAPVEQVDEIAAAMKMATEVHAPMELAVAGLGMFPNPRNARVLWVGVNGSTEALGNLHASLEERIVPLGFPTESRPFNAHLTLARANRRASRDEKKAFGALATQNEVGELAAWRAASVSLIRSQLKPGGAVYTRMAEAALSEK